MATELEQLEQARATRKQETAKERDAQRLKDRKAFFDLEEELGDAAVRWLDAPGYVKGLPTGVVVKVPSKMQYARFQDQLSKANAKNDVKAKREAQDTLADCCMVYPSKDDTTTRSALVEAFPALPVSIAIEANHMAEFKAEDEGKD